MDTDAPHEPKPLIEHAAEPPAPAIDPAKLQEIGAQNPMLAIALAVIGVVGGGAAMKHYAKTAEQKHERSMKELELRSQVPTAQPPPCQAADAATQARIAALEARLSKAESGGLSVGGIPDDLDERLEALEKAIKKKAAK